ncbi:MAG: 2-oxoacid:ferredoxin oxidoreductase subunit beta [Thermoplasmata archaeon]|nr:2-oxoacid:ferredoxin oxidoreductase subunit beta [Thermoplasmata archaeon]
MEEKFAHRLMPYLREEMLPTVFCEGCGCGTVLNGYTHAMDELGIRSEDLISVTGIGCSSWIPSPYLKGDTLHTTHGRAIAFATGVKIMRPDKHVVVIAGDGDLAGIGGNHLIHAARRNIGLSVFLVNNFIYGMTGGQVSPTTPVGIPTSTTPYKNVEYPFNIAELVAAAGANYVARWSTYHVFPLMESMQNAMKKDGFSFIEIYTQCPTSYGRRIGWRKGEDFLNYFKEKAVHVDKAKDMSEEELEDKYVIGKLVERDREEYTLSLRKLNERVQKEDL